MFINHHPAPEAGPEHMGQDTCSSGSPDGSLGCTLKPGHDGPHGGAGTRYLYATWDDDRTTDDA